MKPVGSEEGMASVRGQAKTASREEHGIVPLTWINQQRFHKPLAIIGLAHIPLGGPPRFTVTRHEVSQRQIF